MAFAADPDGTTADPDAAGGFWLAGGTEEAEWPPEEPEWPEEPEEPEPEVGGPASWPGPRAGHVSRSGRLRAGSSRLLGRISRRRQPVLIGLAVVIAIAAGLYAGFQVGGAPGGSEGQSSAFKPPAISGPTLPTLSPSSTITPSREHASRPVTAPAGAARPAGTSTGTGTGAGSGQSLPPATCATGAALGSCGPYNDQQVTGMTAVSGISIGNNVWNPVSGWAQTLHAASPGDWYVTANMPASNTTVVSYPSLQADYVQGNSTSVPLSDYASIYSSFSETMNATSGTNAWATYEVSIGQGSGTSSVDDMMIETNLADGGCSGGATATFGGSGGVPVQSWHLCQYGSELAWGLTGGGEQSGTVDILAMAKWLVSNGYLPGNAGLFSVSYGWQICSTGAQNENFQVSNFSISTTPS
jgi:hypothetical protein